MTCICCTKDKRKYLLELGKRFGHDVVEAYETNGKSRPFSYFDTCEEAMEFNYRQTQFYRQLKEDTKNFCQRKKNV